MLHGSRFGRLLGFAQNGRDIDALVFGKEATQLFAHPRLDLLPVSGDLHRLIAVPRIVQCGGEAERQVFAADPIDTKRAFQQVRSQLCRNDPVDWGYTAVHTGGQPGEARELAAFLGREYQYHVLGAAECL